MDDSMLRLIASPSETSESGATSTTSSTPMAIDPRILKILGELSEILQEAPARVPSVYEQVLNRRNERKNPQDLIQCLLGADVITEEDRKNILYDKIQKSIQCDMRNCLKIQIFAQRCLAKEIEQQKGSRKVLNWSNRLLEDTLSLVHENERFDINPEKMKDRMKRNDNISSGYIHLNNTSNQPQPTTSFDSKSRESVTPNAAEQGSSQHEEFSKQQITGSPSNILPISDTSLYQAYEDSVSMISSGPQNEKVHQTNNGNYDGGKITREGRLEIHTGTSTEHRQKGKYFEKLSDPLPRIVSEFTSAKRDEKEQPTADVGESRQEEFVATRDIDSDIEFLQSETFNNSSTENDIEDVTTGARPYQMYHKKSLEKTHDQFVPNPTEQVYQLETPTNVEMYQELQKECIPNTYPVFSDDKSNETDNINVERLDSTKTEKSSLPVSQTVKNSEFSSIAVDSREVYAKSSEVVQDDQIFTKTSSQTTNDSDVSTAATCEPFNIIYDGQLAFQTSHLQSTADLISFESVIIENQLSGGNQMPSKSQISTVENEICNEDGGLRVSRTRIRPNHGSRQRCNTVSVSAPRRSSRKRQANSWIEHDKKEREQSAPSRNRTTCRENEKDLEEHIEARNDCSTQPPTQSLNSGPAQKGTSEIVDVLPTLTPQADTEAPFILNPDLYKTPSKADAVGTSEMDKSSLSADRAGKRAARSRQRKPKANSAVTGDSSSSSETTDSRPKRKRSQNKNKSTEDGNEVCKRRLEQKPQPIEAVTTPSFSTDQTATENVLHVPPHLPYLWDSWQTQSADAIFTSSFNPPGFMPGGVPSQEPSFYQQNQQGFIFADLHMNEVNYPDQAHNFQNS